MSKRRLKRLPEGAWQLGLSVRVGGQVQVSAASSVEREGEKDHHRGMQGAAPTGTGLSIPAAWSLEPLLAESGCLSR